MLEYDLTCFTFHHLISQLLFESFEVHVYFLSSVVCLNRSFLKEQVWFLRVIFPCLCDFTNLLIFTILYNWMQKIAIHRSKHPPRIWLYNLFWKFPVLKNFSEHFQVVRFKVVEVPLHIKNYFILQNFVKLRLKITSQLKLRLDYISTTESENIKSSNDRQTLIDLTEERN